MAQQYRLRRFRDGKVIVTTSAIDANNLVANGVAEYVRDERPAPAPKAAPKAEPKAGEEK